LEPIQEEAKPLSQQSPTPRQAGFSIVEVMIAALLLLVIALGLLPLFAQSIMSNTQGQESTTAANFARTRLEEFRQLPFDNDNMIVKSGTERQFDEIYLFKAKKWMDGTVAPVGDFALWSRTTWVRDYQASDMTAKLPAGTDPSFIQLKEIEVRVVSNRNSSGGTFSFGAGRQISARVYKAA